MACPHRNIASVLVEPSAVCVCRKTAGLVVSLSLRMRTKGADEATLFYEIKLLQSVLRVDRFL